MVSGWWLVIHEFPRFAMPNLTAFFMAIFSEQKELLRGRINVAKKELQEAKRQHDEETQRLEREHKRKLKEYSEKLRVRDVEYMSKEAAFTTHWSKELQAVASKADKEVCENVLFE